MRKRCRHVTTQLMTTTQFMMTRRLGRPIQVAKMRCCHMHSTSKEMMPDFDRTQKIFANKSSWELLRATVMFRCAATPWLMNPARSLINDAFERQHLPLAKSGAPFDRLLLWLVKQTAFRHFTGGETLSECHAVGVSAAKDQADR